MFIISKNHNRVVFPWPYSFRILLCTTLYIFSIKIDQQKIEIYFIRWIVNLIPQNTYSNIVYFLHSLFVLIHFQTYFGLDVSSVKNAVDRKAIQTMVRTYGQTPRQLFRHTPHPHQELDLSKSVTHRNTQFPESKVDLVYTNLVYTNLVIQI